MWYTPRRSFVRGDSVAVGILMFTAVQTHLPQCFVLADVRYCTCCFTSDHIELCLKTDYLIQNSIIMIYSLCCKYFCFRFVVNFRSNSWSEMVRARNCLASSDMNCLKCCVRLGRGSGPVPVTRTKRSS